MSLSFREARDNPSLSASVRLVQVEALCPILFRDKRFHRKLARCQLESESLLIASSGNLWAIGGRMGRLAKEPVTW